MMRRLVGVLSGLAVLGVWLVASAQADVAPGAPGSPSYFDLARKDCVGTARNSTSKVWFTVADGALSDVYWPTVDATNVHSLQYIVTDGSTFTDLQARDMRYTSVADASGMACTVTAFNSSHRYRITTTYIADASRDAVLMRIRFSGPRSDHLYVRLDPLAGGTGGGGPSNGGANSALLDSANGGAPVAFNTNTTTNAVNRDYAVPTYEALRASTRFADASVGYAGTASDGLTQLDSSRQLSTYTSAPDGHVALTAALAVPRAGAVNLALGFGQTQTAAVQTAGASARQSFSSALRSYQRQWQRYDAQLTRPARTLGSAAIRQYYRSVNVVKASEDKTFPGAIAAGLASPWGQSVPANTLVGGKPMYFGSYREVFARDLYEAFAGLLVAGDLATARAATRFLLERQQQADGSMPRNSLENGKPAPDTGGLQLDETSYPILMAWQSGLTGRGLYRQHIVPAADFLVANGPSAGVERWEEQSGYSPSTIAAEIAGLTAASKIAALNGDAVRSHVYQATADDFARNIKAWTVTTTGPDGPRYFIRLSKTGDPNAAISYNLGNGGPTVDQRSVIDAGFLELVRLGILPASDPDVQASVGVVDRQISVQTPNGVGFYRYGTAAAAGSADGYGDCYQPSQTSCTTVGAPWPPTNTGTGHLWPVLAGERGEFDVAAGAHGGAGLLNAMAAMSSGHYLEPEQAWEDPNLPPSPFGSDPATASIGFTDGGPAGSASPLTWAQSQYARLALALSAGRDLETPQLVSSRYVLHGAPGTLQLTVSSPADRQTVNTPTVTVTGTTAPGARVDAEASAPTSGSITTASATADGSGNFSLVLPVGFGTTKITVTSTLGHSTGYDQLSVTNVALPGTTALDVSDPTGDDNGPGTYQYPTSGDFQPGAFDLTGFKVTQDATNVYVQASIRHLTETFGNPFGAQLLDVYVRDPSVSATSTAAAFPSRNYSIAPSDAWTQRIEVQGFAQPVWVDASGASKGTLQMVVDDSSGTATMIVPKSAFGTVASGWVFTVVLTGQDGFSPDQARSFASTPQAFQFGVCAPGGTSPICAVSPGSVPKVMDTITPAGVSQSSELDPTAGPVVLQGVTAP
jgi:glucoamylase